MTSYTQSFLDKLFELNTFLQVFIIENFFQNILCFFQHIRAIIDSSTEFQGGYHE
jgi:hypothetical protein